MSADHLGPYTLTATNDYGEKTVRLELKKASAAPKVKPKPEAEQGKQGSGTVQGKHYSYNGHLEPGACVHR